MSSALFYLPHGIAFDTLLDLDYARSDLRELRHHERVVAGNDQAGIGGQLLHAVLGAQVRLTIERLRYGEVLLQVFVEVHVVAGQDHYARGGIDGDELRGIGVLAADVGGDAREEFLGIAIHQTDAAFGVELYGQLDVIGINAAVRAARLPGRSGVVFQLILLEPDFGLRKEVHAAGMIPMHVADDYVSDIFGLDAGAGDSIGGDGEIHGMPLLDIAVAMETRIEKDVLAIAPDQPDHHGDIELTARLGAFDQAIESKAGNGGVADSVDFVLRLGLSVEGREKRQR